MVARVCACANFSNFARESPVCDRLFGARTRSTDERSLRLRRHKAACYVLRRSASSPLFSYSFSHARCPARRALFLFPSFLPSSVRALFLRSSSIFMFDFSFADCSLRGAPNLFLQTNLLRFASHRQLCSPSTFFSSSFPIVLVGRRFEFYYLWTKYVGRFDVI